jgi:hypothetical protein
MRSTPRYLHRPWNLIGLTVILTTATSSCTRSGSREALTEREGLGPRIYESPYATEAAPSAPARKPASVNAVSPIAVAAPTLVCESVEYAPRENESLNTGQVAELQSAFQSAKHDLITWLATHRGELPKGTFNALEIQVRGLRWEAPANDRDPDLRWRGIGVWGRDPQGDPMLRLGPGFATLLKQDPERARFELIRLAAMGWAPCELGRRSVSAPWGAYLKCMGITEKEQGCGVGNYSEAGWAVSSAVASTLATPNRVGCTVPAFAKPATAGCPALLFTQKEKQHD